MSSEGWHFNICLHSREQQQRGALLIPISASVTLELLLDSLLKKTKNPCHALWMNTSWLCVCVCVTLPHRRQGFSSDYCISLFSPPSSFSYIFLPGTLMILKSACSYNASYIDRLISVFMRSLQKMVREHLSPQQANPGVTETSTGTQTEQMGIQLGNIYLFI